MSTAVPTSSDLKKGVTDGAVPGIALGLGETIGRGIAGPGIGTALGGAVAAATQSAENRHIMSLVAFERGATEMLAAPASAGGQGVK